MGGYPAQSCHRLPFELSVCPTCSQGVKPARGWTWIDAINLFSPSCGERLLKDTAYEGMELVNTSDTHCLDCVVCRPSLLVPDKEFKGTAPEHFGMSGLIWIGEKFYPTPESFIEEANVLGVSRRISVVPNGFVLGETRVFFAHRLAVEDDDNPAVDKRHPGIFEAFMPTSIDYVIKGEETDEELAWYEKRGISLVKVVPKDVSEFIPKGDPPLAEIFKPGLVKTLKLSGYNTLAELRGRTIERLMKMKGVSKKTAELINAVIDKIDKFEVTA